MKIWNIIFNKTESFGKFTLVTMPVKYFASKVTETMYHFYTPGLTPFRGLVPLGRRNLVPIPPQHTLWEGGRGA